MRVLVTGYGGFLGAAVCRQLIDRGFSVRGLARGSYPELQAIGVESISGSVTDLEVCRKASKDCIAVVHTAAKAGVWGKWSEYYEINTSATVRLLDAANQNQVRAFVHTSSPSVTFDGQHQSGVDESVPYPTRWLCYYPQTKALAEQAVIEAAQSGKILGCALRPHLIWGLGDPHLFPRVIDRTLKGRLRRVGSGTNLIDVVHVENAARAHVLAVEKLLSGEQRVNGQSFFITDGKPVACWEWVSQILKAAGLTVPDKSISFAAAYRIGAVLEGAYRLMRRKDEPPMTRFVAAQLALDHYFSIDKARRLLGYDPQVDVEAEFERCRPWLTQLSAGRLRS
jgi:2-alkyl-3-oxoalkanoate reductase